ncbi:Protein transport protein BET1 [Cytospora mali]|uniref:Protein transport protein BET1 n=1 Tax=Cytospora mali TaxID=578113 RepID=A0A194V4F7_CYTMA|nr:Protein transport protein BET1 [Valsa mali var. pyri (nom. inval.)]
MASRFNSTLHQRDSRSALFEGYTGSGADNRSRVTPSPSRLSAGGGQYSDAVLNELESQNDAQIEGIMGKVRVLKDMTVAIGDEIRDSSALAEKMNDQFDRARLRLRGTMNRMLLMAERTGVGWKVWLGFFAAVILLFTYVWLF